MLTRSCTHMEAMIELHILTLACKADSDPHLPRFAHLALHGLLDTRPNNLFTRLQRQPPANIHIAGDEVASLPHILGVPAAQLYISGVRLPS